MSAVENLLSEVCDSSTRARISRAFELMGVAEEEIRAAMLRYPRSRRKAWNCFKVLCPSEALQRVGEGVYRSHCSELLERAVRGEDLRPGTKAEVLAVVSAMTLVSRLDRDVELLGLRIAAEIFPEKGEALVGGMHWEESHRGALEEHLMVFRRRLADGDRRLPAELRDPPRGWERR